MFAAHYLAAALALSTVDVVVAPVQAENVVSLVTLTLAFWL